MKFEKIKSIKSVGERDSYDLSIKGVHKGYLVNGFQTHNSGGDFRSDFTIEDAFATFEDGRKFKRKYPEVADIASRMEGQTRGFGQHAAAIVISSENLKLGERGYLRRGKDEEPVINWDKYDIEHVGLMKLDILGLNALTVLDKTKKLVQKRRGIDIDWESLPLNDKKIFDEFTKGNNVGTFQVGCISGDTFVGIKEPKRIKDLQCGEITESIKDDGSIINNKIKRVFKTGTKEVKLINIGGIRLKATEDHKFLTETGWKRLKDICVGESVLTADIGYTYCPCGCGNKLTKRSASRNHPYHGWKLGHCGKNPSVSKKISESVKKVWEGDKYKENWVNKMREKEKDPDFLVNRNLLSKKARDNREYIQKASDAQKKLWSNEKYRVKQRKLCKYGFDNFILKGGMIGNTRGGGRGKHGKREDIGHYVRSTWEANYARILNLLGIKYEYEKDVFALSNGKTYRPDFKLSDKEYVEIKGYMDRASEEKLRLFKNEFPDIKLKLILGKEYEELKSKYKNMVDWENTETKFVPVLAIEEWGEVETWDMEMENSEAPSYVANGISVHNSLGLIKFCRELGIENFETLVHATALYRPGTLRSGMTSTFQLRKTGKEKFEYLNSYMESITKDTYGVILYQEQVMRFMYELGGLPWKTADTVRKVMSKTQGVDQFLKFRDMFAEGCEKRGTLDRKTAAKLWSELANFGSYGFNKCLSGLTSVLVESDKDSKAQKRISIEDLFKNKDKYKNIFIYDQKTKASRKAKIKEVYKTGVKNTIQLDCKNSRGIIRTIRTTEDHKFLTESGWKTLKELCVGEKVMAKGASTVLFGKDNPAYGRLPWNKDKNYFSPKLKGTHPLDRTIKKMSESAKKREIHGHTGHLHSEETKEKARKRALKQYEEGAFPHTMTGPHTTIVEKMKEHNLYDGFICEYNFMDRYSVDIANPEKKIAVEIHGDYWHANPKYYQDKEINSTQKGNVLRDIRKENLLKKEGWELVVIWENQVKKELDSCINRISAAIDDTKANPWEFVEVIEMHSKHPEMTYDIEVDDEEHNYIANMFVVHNSHAVEYSIITYWDQYCKVYFPEEFMCASLTYGSEDKKDLLVKEAIRLGIEVLPPKAGISKAKDWVVGDKKLYSPYIELKGFGPSTAAKCEDVLDKLERNGSVPEVKLSKKVLDALEAVGAFTDEELEYKKLDGLMTFSLNRDPAGEIRTIVETLKEHGLEVGNLSDIDFKVIDKKMVNYFGCLTEIKFGYRGKLDSYEKKIGASGLADNLGGVYGNFQDSTDFAMIVFSSEIYLKKKDRVEHCSGDFAVAKVNRPMRTTSIHCSEIWFDDELKRCEIGNMGIKAIKRKRSVINLDIQNCSDCSLRTECKSPVAPSKGIYNIAIIGEAPGSEEDEKGIPFCGKSGREVWKELEKYKMERSMFHVTNVVKCFPSKTKTPTKRQISSCSKWIDQELKEVNPIIMLAFGNTALRYFTEKESGIMDLSGTTEWSEKHKAWICWCIHPASVLYHRENYSLFESGIKNFCEKVKNLGF